MSAAPTSRPPAAAGAVAVRPISGRTDLRRFIRLPFRIHAGDPNWVPPLDADVRSVLAPSHPFHAHAEVDCFLAWRDGRVVGRIAAIDNRAHREFHGEQVGFFGLFECEDDDEAAAALLGAVEDWLRVRGLRACRGPFNLSTNDELWSPGVLIDGFDSPPLVMMGHGAPYYGPLVEAAGYDKCKDLLAYWADHRTAAVDRIARLSGRIRERTGVVMRSLDMKNLAAEIDRILAVYNSAWERNWGFVPMSRAEIDHMAKALKPVVNPELCLVIEKDGEAVGFALGLPDYNQVLRHMNGRLFPFGFLKFLRYRRHIDLTRVLTLGLKPEWRNRGLDVLMILELFEAGSRAGAGRGECSWILEDNVEMRNGLERLGARAYKTYRVYEKPLD